jgi:hypothetical protein
MIRILSLLSILTAAALACDLSVTIAPPTGAAPQPTNTAVPASVTPIPATPVPVASPTLLPPPTLEGVEVTVNPISLLLPPGLAGGVRGEYFARAEGESVSPWETTPGHTRVQLEGYVLQERFHQPQIFVYPASEYAQIRPAAFEAIHRLDNILYGPAGPALNDQFPAVPFFNARPLFTSNARLIAFQDGQGVRSVTQYSQYNAPVNNHELFYHFEGLTRDGEYYIIAILPLSTPVLQETADAGAVVPPGGVSYPGAADPNADWQGYYNAAAALLDSTAPAAFGPGLDQLDSLIQSIRIAQ